MSRKPTVTNRTAATVLEHHFGKRPKYIRRLHGGISNHVFESKIGGDEVIVRIADDPAKLQNFQKEQWAVRKARKARIPAPEILEVGNAAVQFPYMISLRVRGQDASTCPNRMEVARAMGQYAARINALRTSSFGGVFDWSRNQLSRNKTWGDFLNDEMKMQERLDLLASQKMLTPTGLKRLQNSAREMRTWKGRPSLTHGDMRLKNMLLDDSGKIQAILDWENCTSNLAPYWELSIALHDLSIDEKEAFLEGYGLAPRDYAKLALGVKTLNILNYAPIIAKAVETKNRATLDRLRARLHGALDHTL